MKYIVLEDEVSYDGHQISSLWAYENTRSLDDTIIAFRGPCDVSIEHMIDLEDRVLDESIQSPDMIHFICEHFDSIDLKLVYARQRLFVLIVSEILSKYGLVTERNGDDLFFNGRKLSVSIASVSPVSQKFHFGMNIVHEHYASLEMAGIKEDDIYSLMEEICDRYCMEFKDIERDLRKSRPLDVI